MSFIVRNLSDINQSAYIRRVGLITRGLLESENFLGGEGGWGYFLVGVGTFIGNVWYGGKTETRPFDFTLLLIRAFRVKTCLSPS